MSILFTPERVAATEIARKYFVACLYDQNPFSATDGLTEKKSLLAAGRNKGREMFAEHLRLSGVTNAQVQETLTRLGI